MKNHSSFYWVFLVSAICIFSSNIVIAASTSEEEIKAVISKIYDKPDLGVMTTPVAVVDNYALADWTQGNRGGRALMQKIGDQWAVAACGADGFKTLSYLEEAGIPRKTAEALIVKLNDLEKSVDPHRLHLFSLFGTPDDPNNMEEHHHHENHEQHTH